MAARAEDGTEKAKFNFANACNSYSAFLPPDSPLVGKEIVSTTIRLNVNVDEGSDGKNFLTNIGFPIEPLPDGTNAFSLTGESQGWSGAGGFLYTKVTKRFNGKFISVRFGAETPCFGGQINSDLSWIEFEYLP